MNVLFVNIDQSLKNDRFQTCRKHILIFIHLILTWEGISKSFLIHRANVDEDDSLEPCNIRKLPYNLQIKR